MSIVIDSQVLKQKITEMLSDKFTEINNEISRVKGDLNNALNELADIRNLVNDIANRIGNIPVMNFGSGVTDSNGYLTVNYSSPVQNRPIVLVSSDAITVIEHLTDAQGRYTGVRFRTMEYGGTTVSVVSGVSTTTASVLTSINYDTSTDWTVSGGYYRHRHGGATTTVISSITPSTTSVVRDISLRPVSKTIYYLIMFV